MRMCLIFDGLLAAGVGIRDIGSKAMDFGLQMMGLLEKHYPVSSHSAFPLLF